MVELRGRIVRANAGVVSVQHCRRYVFNRTRQQIINARGRRGRKLRLETKLRDALHRQQTFDRTVGKQIVEISGNRREATVSNNHVVNRLRNGIIDRHAVHDNFALADRPTGTSSRQHAQVSFVTVARQRVNGGSASGRHRLRVADQFDIRTQRRGYRPPFGDDFAISHFRHGVVTIDLYLNRVDIRAPPSKVVFVFRRNKNQPAKVQRYDVCRAVLIDFIAQEFVKVVNSFDSSIDNLFTVNVDGNFSDRTFNVGAAAPLLVKRK